MRWLLLILLGCEPMVELDAGIGDASASRCPLQIVTGQPCDLRGLVCPLQESTCECRSYEWRCFGDAGL